ncbi:hypothetical protein [Natronorarus salvus]|uniref:hypothetical protein n=1 Tax=Natronorarus salvus TaxID=3117733 RepID=UPI002F260163
MDDDFTRTLAPRTIEGTESLVSTDPGEIFLDMPATSPRYIRVREGEIVQEGDIRSRDERELESVALRKWNIEEIGTKTVIGTSTETGEQREWDRESLEHRLGIGTFSTDLTNFERVSVTESEGEDDDHPPVVIVVVYGNNGTKFIQRYRIVEDGMENDNRQLELYRSDRATEAFDEDIHEQFVRSVERALRGEGYAV